MLLLVLIFLLDFVVAESSWQERKEPMIHRRARVMNGRKVSQIGSYSCYELQWASVTKLGKIIDSRLVYLEADHKEIPVTKTAREALERAAIQLSPEPVCINIEAELLHVEVVLYTIGGVESKTKEIFNPAKPVVTPMPMVVRTTRHWLERYEEILREADPERKILKTSAAGSCELVMMEMPAIDLIADGDTPIPAKFRQGICHGSCFNDPITRRKRCCKPALLEDFEFSFTTPDGSKRFRRISRFLVTACGFR